MRSWRWLVLASLLISQAYATQVSGHYCEKQLSGEVTPSFEKSRSGFLGTAWVKNVFAKVYFSRSVMPGYCHNNVAMFIKKALASSESVKPEDLNVILISRPSKSDHPTPNLVSVGGREGPVDELFHVVVEYGGDIYDLSFGREPLVLPKNEYFRQMYLAEAPTATEASLSLPPRLQLEQDRRDRHKLFSEEQVLNELQVRIMPARFYLENFWAEIDLNIGNPDFFWSKKGRPSAKPLWRYLGLKGRPNDPSFRAKNRVAVYQSEGLKIKVDQEAIEAGDFVQTVNALALHRTPFGYPEFFNRLNRGLVEIKPLYSGRMLNLAELRGKTVLDMGTGGGLFVEELREFGIAAFGLDLVLSARQLKKLYQPGSIGDRMKLDPARAGLFILADAKNTPIADQQVDVIYDTYSLTRFQFVQDQNLLRSLYEEWRRILKIGGVIRFAPLDISYVDRVSEFIKTIPGLELTSVDETLLEPRYSRAVEIRRVK